MKDKQALLKELREKFNEEKKRLGFKSSYEDVESAGFIEDLILSEGYVSNRLSRQIINRLVDGPSSWATTLHNWIMLPPGDLLHSNEGKKLTSEEREEVKRMFAKIIYLIRKNKRIVFQGYKGEGDFLDEIVEFHKKEFKEFMLKYHKKFEEFWKNFEKNKQNSDNRPDYI